MRVFGPIPWSPDLGPPVATPVGELCLHCGEPIAIEDSGVIMPFLDSTGPRQAAEHRECLLRQVFGSVGHQRGLCSCNGGPGTMDDPPGMTNREAARAAVEEWERNHRLRRPGPCSMN